MIPDKIKAGAFDHAVKQKTVVGLWARIAEHGNSVYQAHEPVFTWAPTNVTDEPVSLDALNGEWQCVGLIYPVVTE